LLAALALLVLVLAIGGPASGAKPCWRVILDDWTDNTRLDGTYSIACYDEALANIPGDLRDYTDAYDQIANARQDALRRRRLQGPIATGNKDAPGDAGSIPLPLIVLGAFAGVLVAAGGAGFVARKLQARRTEPPTK
jgi:hypothetical protein